MTKFISGIVTLGLIAISNAQASPQSLLDIYQLAIANDPVLASVQSGTVAAQEKLEQGKALYRPSVNFNSGISVSQDHVKFMGASIFKNGEESFHTYDYGINVTQSLYNKEINAKFEQAKALVSQADNQQALAKQDLILRTTQAYFDELLAQDKIELIKSQKTSIIRQLDLAKANFDIGTSNVTDLNEAQARFDLINAQEIGALSELEVKQRSLESIIGDPPRALLTVREDLMPIYPEPADMEDWVKISEQNNLNLLIQQQSLAIASQEVEKQNAGNLPTVNIVGGYNENHTNGSIYGYGYDIKDASIGLQLQIPIYQGGSINSKIRESLANKEKAQDDVETTRRQVDLRTQESFLNLTSSIAQLKAYEQALKSSLTQLDSTNLGYKVGARTSLDVLNAQQQYFSAKRDLLESRYLYLINTLKLKSATGTLEVSDVEYINQQLVQKDDQ